MYLARPHDGHAFQQVLVLARDPRHRLEPRVFAAAPLPQPDRRLEPGRGLHGLQGLERGGRALGRERGALLGLLLAALPFEARALALLGFFVPAAR